jgi:hypothetical protein
MVALIIYFTIRSAFRPVNCVMHTIYTFIYIASALRPKFLEVISGSEGN